MSNTTQTREETELFELLRIATCENSDSGMFERNVVKACEEAVMEYLAEKIEEVIDELTVRILNGEADSGVIQETADNVKKHFLTNLK